MNPNFSLQDDQSKTQGVINGSAIGTQTHLVSPRENPREKVTYVEHLIRRYGSVDQVISSLKEAMKIDPLSIGLDYQVFVNAMGMEEEAYETSNMLMKVAPHDQRVLFNRGWHLIHRNRLREGLALLENGRPLGNYGNPRLNSNRPLWNPQFGRGHRVILGLEGGLGDEIIHFRFGRDLVEKHNCKVTIVCHPSLAQVFAEQTWVSAVAQREAAPGIYHDSWLPGMSAALALGYEIEDIKGAPYLSVIPQYRKKWQTILGPKSERIRVGIRWAGNPGFEHQQMRRFPPDILIQLPQLVSHIGKVDFYSFQRDDNLESLPENIRDLAPLLGDWSDTSAAIEQMDLMITSCTSVAHMSAALGKETWVIVPALPYFIWANSGVRSPWYNSVKLYRQKQYGDWSVPQENVHRDFMDFVRTRVGQ